MHDYLRNENLQNRAQMNNVPLNISKQELKDFFSISILSQHSRVINSTAVTALNKSRKKDGWKHKFDIYVFVYNLHPTDIMHKFSHLVLPKSFHQSPLTSKISKCLHKSSKSPKHSALINNLGNKSQVSQQQSNTFTEWSIVFPQWKCSCLFQRKTKGHSMTQNMYIIHISNQRTQVDDWHHLSIHFPRFLAKGNETWHLGAE